MTMPTTTGPTRGPMRARTFPLSPDLVHLLELRELKLAVLIVVELLERLLEVALDLLLVELLDEVPELVLADIPVLVFIEDVEDELEHLGRLEHAERAHGLHELAELDLLGVLRVDEIEDGVAEHAAPYVDDLIEAERVRADESAGQTACRRERGSDARARP